MCKRMKIGKLLCCFSAFCTVFLLTICSFDSIQVSADSENTLTLTPQQALALFGTSIQVSNWNGTTSDTYTFNYVGTTSQFATSDVLTSDIPWSSCTAVENERIHWYEQECLVYAAAGGYRNVSGMSGLLYGSGFWNESYLPAAASYPSRFDIDFSLDLTGITSYTQNVFWTMDNWMYNQAQDSYARLVCGSGFRVQNASVAQGSGGYLAQGFMNTYPTAGNQMPPSNSWNGRFAGILQDYSFDSADTVSGLGLYLQSAASVTGLYGSSDSLTLYGTNFSGGEGLNISYIYLGLPKLGGYVPPVVTTAQTTNPYSYGTATGHTNQTVDLSNLESGVAAIVQQEQYNGDTLDWIGTNTMITANNLAHIANTLDAIYSDMVRNGQIAVNLVPADPLRALDTNVHDQIHDSLSNFTTAQIPINYRSDMNGAFSFVNTLYTKFTSDGLAFFGWLGILSLTMYVVVWFIFRGRG